MSTQVLLTLPDDLYEQARQWAAITQRDLSHTLADTLSLFFTPLQLQAQNAPPVAQLTDSQVLLLSQARMSTSQGERLSELQQKQREEALTASEQGELAALMHVYHQLWIRQSAALAEAVRRGLRKPLEP